MEPIPAPLPARNCPSCGVQIPDGAPQGLCPKCLLAGASARTATEGVAGSAVVPPIEEVAAAFPQLEIIGTLGTGGMGVVYKARQKHLDRLVALKVMSESLAAKPAFVERFEREARVLAKLNHPNIVTLHDFGQAGGFCYLLMEYVDGVNLAQAMRAGRFTPAQALAVVPRICEALQYAHELGVLHRDIKPANLLLDDRGRVKIADFGVAKLLGNEPVDVALTESGAAVGTPAYMAPEQFEHPTEVDHRADIYSLGVVFYEMLTGELPRGQFAPPSEKLAMDGRIDAIVMRALKKERELRQQSAEEVRTQVEGVAHGPAPVPVPPGADKRSTTTPDRRSTVKVVSWIILALVGMVIVVAGILFPVMGYFWLSTGEPDRVFPRIGRVVSGEALVESEAPASRSDATRGAIHPPPPGADRERLQVRLDLAEKQLAENLKRHEVGVISPIELAESQRDVDVGRCLLAGDLVGAAAHRLKFAQMKLDGVSRRLANGKASADEQLQAEADVRLLTIDWQEVVKRQSNGDAGRSR